jgi:hypothetical protein
MSTFELPSTQLVESTFMLDDGTTATPYNSGLSYTVTQVRDPAWRVRIQTIPLDQAGRQMWSAWKAKLKGGLNNFTAIDISRAAPLAYAGALSPSDIAAGFNGTASVTSIGLSGQIALSGLPAGYKAREGDRLGLEQAGLFGLHEIIADATADGTGHLSLTVAPFITSYFTTSAVARLWQPKGRFRLDWKTWQQAVTASPSPASFEGYEVLK